jgi:signal transduction histidine kinase
MAYLNWKLTEEATRASTLLGMGKVSHDIGNLAASLYANISFSDFAISALRDQVRSDPTPDALEPAVGTINEMLFDLRLSVDRIVGYSRLISDLSAGRELRPDMRVAPLSETVKNSAAYLESEGRTNRIVLRYQIDENAPPTLHDELFVFRIVQNLVGNAIKAVRETVSDDVLDNPDAVAGEVEVRYRFDQNHIIEVKDSGPGMSEEVAERILSGTARSQWGKGGGSGWGTKIVLELAASHKGRVEIDSAPGAGSTFRVVIPHSG